MHDDPSVIVEGSRGILCVKVVTILQIVPGAGHVIHSDTPDEFNALVGELLRQADAGALPPVKGKNISPVETYSRD